MPDLNKSFIVNSAGDRPLYEVRVNDGGADGGSNTVVNVTVESTGSVTTSDLDASVQALAAFLDELPGFTLTWVKKITVNEETL